MCIKCIIRVICQMGEREVEVTHQMQRMHEKVFSKKMCSIRDLVSHETEKVEKRVRVS